MVGGGSKKPAGMSVSSSSWDGRLDMLGCLSLGGESKKPVGMILSSSSWDGWLGMCEETALSADGTRSGGSIPDAPSVTDMSINKSASSLTQSIEDFDWFDIHGLDKADHLPMVYR